MPKSNLWSAQIEAIGNLEKSLAANKRRALIQMATGSGKTYTAVNFVYRLIKLAGARRVLFLVDRGNLGDQTLKEFQQFVTPDDGRKFTELYNVQHLQSQLDRVSRVCISTIQRLYSMLRCLLFWLKMFTARREQHEETGSASSAFNKAFATPSDRAVSPPARFCLS
jgi:type I site-specific restriction endonuclease